MNETRKPRLRVWVPDRDHFGSDPFEYVAAPGGQRLVRLPRELTVETEVAGHPVLLALRWSAPQRRYVVQAIKAPDPVDVLPETWEAEDGESQDVDGWGDAETQRRAERGALGLPARVVRQAATLDMLTRVVRIAAEVVNRVPSDGRDERVEGKITKREAEDLARGWTKSQRSKAWKQAACVVAYEEARAERDGWRDIYGEVARRVGMSRATVHRHLSAAGVIAARGDR